MARNEPHDNPTLRERDSEVDPILWQLLLAKRELERLLARINGINFTPDDAVRLRQWRQQHSAVLDFYVFQGLEEYLPPPEFDDTFIEKERIEEILRYEFTGSACIGYADEKLGIERGFEYWDGLHSGGVNYQRADGRYEDVNKRLERVERSLDAGDLAGG